MQKGKAWYSAPTVYGDVTARPTQRQTTSRPHVGTAGFTEGNKSLPQNMYPMFKRAFKDNYDAPMPRNVTQVTAQKPTTSTISGYTAPPTRRQTTEVNTYVAPAGFAQGQQGAYHVTEQGTIASPTMRQLTQDKTYQGPMGNREQNKGGYHVQQQGTVAPATLHQLT